MIVNLPSRFAMALNRLALDAEPSPAELAGGSPDVSPRGLSPADRAGAIRSNQLSAAGRPGAASAFVSPGSAFVALRSAFASVRSAFASVRSVLASP